MMLLCSLIAKNFNTWVHVYIWGLKALVKFFRVAEVQNGQNSILRSRNPKKGKIVESGAFFSEPSKVQKEVPFLDDK